MDSQVNQTLPSIRETAELMAREHRSQDPEMRAVRWVCDDDEVLLIEVTDSIGDIGEVLPFRFAPDLPDVPYPSVVILLGPGDWERIQSGELTLPDKFRGSVELDEG